MKTTSLADVRAQLSRYVDEVNGTHERVTITKNGRPAAVLISAEDLEQLEETLFWASRPRPDDEAGAAVSAEEVGARLDARLAAVVDSSAPAETQREQDLEGHGGSEMLPPTRR